MSEDELIMKIKFRKRLNMNNIHRKAVERLAQISSTHKDRGGEQNLGPRELTLNMQRMHHFTHVIKIV